MCWYRTMAIFLWQLPRIGLAVFVKFYRYFLSPWLGASCRFYPSCSTYALEALEVRGAVIGTYLTLHRLVRCNPWCEGGHDPVPVANSGKIFSRLAERPNASAAPPSSSEKNLS